MALQELNELVVATNFVGDNLTAIFRSSSNALALDRRALSASCLGVRIACRTHLRITSNLTKLQPRSSIG